MKVNKFSIKNYRSLKDITIGEFESTTIFFMVIIMQVNLIY